MEAATITGTRFPPIGREKWREGAEESIAGAPDQRSPWHERARLAPRFRGPSPLSTLLQRIDDRDPDQANRRARAALAAGAGGIAIVFENAINDFAGGLPADPEALAAALEDLPLTGMRVRLDPHPASRQSVDWLVQIVAERKLDPSRLDLSFGLDPAANFAASGNLNMSLEALRQSMPQSLAHFFALGVPALLLEADGRVAHNAGAAPERELGVALAAAVSHLRMFEIARQPLLYATPHIGFTLAVDSDLYLSGIKIVALRALWRQAQLCCGIEPSRASIHAATSFRLMEEAGGEAIALALAGAAVGGADTLAAHRGLPDATIGTISEALAAMAVGLPSSPVSIDDVAALADEAWQEFLAIEEEGGLLDSLATGGLQRRVWADRQYFETAEAPAAPEPAMIEGPAGAATTCEPLRPVPFLR